MNVVLKQPIDIKTLEKLLKMLYGTTNVQFVNGKMT